MNNGLIPPAIPGEEGLSEWLLVLVDRLRKHFGDVAEGFSCIFLTHDGHCAIYEFRPGICREFLCEAAKAAMASDKDP